MNAKVHPPWWGEVLVAMEAGASAMGVSVTPTMLEQSATYLMHLVGWNRTHNLTAVRDPLDMVTRHILDSWTVLPWLGDAQHVLDVGTGAGLPGLPVAMLQPHRHVSLLDAHAKKCAFLRHVVCQLGLTNVTVFQKRLETVTVPPAYDVLLSRAMTSLERLWSMGSHLLAPGGAMVVMKGLHDDDVSTTSLANVLCERRRVQVPGDLVERSLVRMSQP